MLSRRFDRIDIKLTSIGLYVLAVLAFGGCGSTPEPESNNDQPMVADPYVDWDRADWLLDRYIMVNLQDYVTTQNLGQRKPAKKYQDAITYKAHRDSMGLIPFLTLTAEEAEERRRLAANNVAEARRVALGAVGYYRENAAQGYQSNSSSVNMAPIPQGVETAVTTAISHLTLAVGMDPSNPAAWRDLAYFFGVVGDRTRQQRALSATLVALDHIDPDQTNEGDLARLRRDVLLDLSWLARDLGQPELTQAYLDHVQNWLHVESPERSDRIFEANVLRGLAYADQNEWLAAVETARALPRYETTRRALRGGVRDDLRWHMSAPNSELLGSEKAAWPKQKSDFGRRWIKAMAGAPSGDIDHALWLLGPPATDLEFPSRLAWRFWQDQGRLYTRAGEMGTARHCFEWAAMYRPYLAFFPTTGVQGAFRMGTAEATERYYTAYGMFFLCGDRRAFDRDVESSISPHLANQGG